MRFINRVRVNRMGKLAEISFEKLAGAWEGTEYLSVAGTGGLQVLGIDR